MAPWKLTGNFDEIPWSINRWKHKLPVTNQFNAKKYLKTLALCWRHRNYFFGTYLNYANIVYGNTKMPKLKKLSCQQKEALGMIFNKDKFESGTNIYKRKKISNISELTHFSPVSHVTLD